MKAKIWNFSKWIYETDPRKLTAFFDATVKEAGFKVLDEIEHYFTPCGYTKIYMLAESHFAIHTFPEEGKTYIELSSCNEQKYDAFKKAVANAA